MGDTAIEWSDKVWNAVRGCTRVSPGCGGGTPGGGGGCYAERQAIRQSNPGGKYHGLVKSTPDGPRWTGKVVLDEVKLWEPLTWKKPRMVFVNSMSDLFHEALADAQIDRVLTVMLLTPHVTYQVLTKRAARMRRYLSDPELYQRVLDAARTFRLRQGYAHLQRVGISDPSKFPPKNIWWGVSVEDQKRAEERLADLLATPARIRWVSAEPLLGPIDFLAAIQRGLGRRAPLDCVGFVDGLGYGLDWVVAGGESGPGARPCRVEWLRFIAKQCFEGGTAFFLKQVGAVPTAGYYDRAWRDHFESLGLEWPDPIDWNERDGQPSLDARVNVRGGHKKGAAMEEWPAEYRVREFPEVSR
jgi:protein gp37